MEITTQQLLTAIKNHEPLARVIFVWGTEEYYKDAITASLVATTFAGLSPSDRALTVFDKELDLQELSTAINSYPFFSNKTMVILKEPKLLAGDKQKESEKRKEEQLALAELLSAVPEYCQVLCLTAKLDKRSKFYKLILATALVTESQSLRSYNLKPWLDAEAALYGCQLTQGAATLVMEYMSLAETVPLLLLKQEIAKLAIYAGTRTLWTQEDVKNIFSELPEVSRFALTNAIAEGRIQAVLELLALEKKKGTNVLPLGSIVAFQIRRLLQVKELVTSGVTKSELASKLKLAPFILQKLLEQSANFSLSSLENCLTALAALNMNLRRGGRQYAKLEEILLTLFLERSK
ncbi:MAG: DNA polymerase III subunit delta [Acidaminococcaceae bacterium]